MAYIHAQMTGGLPLELDFMFPARPEDPEMRESASIWLFEENGAFAFPRNGIEAQGAVWDRHRFDCNFAFPDGRVLRESTRADTLPAIGPDGRANILGTGPFTRIGGTTELCTFHLGNEGVSGFNNQQSGVRYTLDGMTAFGMIERSSPGEMCTVAG